MDATYESATIIPSKWIQDSQRWTSAADIPKRYPIASINESQNYQKKCFPNWMPTDLKEACIQGWIAWRLGHKHKQNDLND